jgi:hypothetical protein
MTRETECQSRVHENRAGKIRYATMQENHSSLELPLATYEI